jgi:hypothetical protein
MPTTKASIIVTLALLSSAVAVAGPKKPQKLPLPPLVYHGERISNYACEMTEISGTSVRYVWSLDVYAEYGPKHQRHWTKRLGIFEGSSNEDTVTNRVAESAASGAPISPMTTWTKVGAAQQKCQEWKQQVMQETAVVVQPKPGTASGAKQNRP